jgi:hypothetical protein
MSEQLKQLQNLQAQLHEVNQELVRAARPLERVSDMNDEQRGQLAKQLRAGLARWETVTRQISQVLEAGSANGS